MTYLPDPRPVLIAFEKPLVIRVNSCAFAGTFI